MRRKIKTMFSMLLVLCISISSIRAYAIEIEPDESYTWEEQRRIDEIINSDNSKQWIGVVRENIPIEDGISPHPMCVDCSVLTVTVCLKEAILVDEGFHNTFLLGIPTDCYAYYFESHGVSACSICGKVVESYGQHACWEVHKKCSKGEYDVCPMRVS